LPVMHGGVAVRDHVDDGMRNGACHIPLGEEAGTARGLSHPAEVHQDDHHQHGDDRHGQRERITVGCVEVFLEGQRSVGGAALGC
jgi:hypothetical protein